MWLVHHTIASDIFKEVKKGVDEAWRNIVLKPCPDIMKRFLKNDDHNIIIDHCLHQKFLEAKRVPIIVGRSNSYFENLMEDHVFMFKYKYDTCFIWIDVEQSDLNRRVDMRLDQMVNAAKIEPDSDFTDEDFFLQAIVYIEIFLTNQCFPIFFRGSNS
ncbi:hypothetical protein H5410_020883 [Solanum commersonii]|uniref:Uncharacterized protein n=1 Tax=Solanum commersonii TaxID=4109 RepID=A0A9J5ZAC8_SOLCO|nr:hypothetical protein H5410_020883 [Solanum commersonii]